MRIPSAFILFPGILSAFILFSLQGLHAEGNTNRNMFVGVGLTAGATELSFVPKWSNYIRNARRVDRMQLLIEQQSLRDDRYGVALVNEILRNESREDLHRARLLREQAYGGTVALFGVTAFMGLAPDTALPKTWRHPGVAAFGFTAAAFGLSFAGKYSQYNKEIAQLKHEGNVINALLLSNNLETVLSASSYQLRNSEKILIAKTRKSESGLISLEYFLTSAVALYAFFSDSAPETASSQPAFAPFFLADLAGANLGIVHRF
ncbi:MAG: hypothetical protein K8S54_06230 [Spirochaetia bacterium]|nr:hypothetical protein [Spirochaetia bacterium]